MNSEAMQHAEVPSGKSHAARIGVVLSSGGGRGVYAHTGFLLALERMGIDIRASAGCSAGAVVGGVVASGTDLHRWTHTIAQVARNEFWTPDSLPRFLWQMTVHRGRGYTGLSSADAAIDFLPPQSRGADLRRVSLSVLCGRGRSRARAQGGVLGGRTCAAHDGKRGHADCVPSR